MRTFEDLVAEASAHDFTGWDFSFVEDRIVRAGTPWDYGRRVNELAAGARTLVDLGTGGGEFLSGIDPLPPCTVATESYMRNVPVAGKRLAHVGAYVVASPGANDNARQAPADESGPLPFRDDSIDVVIDRHTAFRAAEVARVLRAGGAFLTQQVGTRDCIELCDALGGVTPCLSPSVDEYRRQLDDAGFDIHIASEAFCAKTFLDVGALLSYVLPIPWAFVGFSMDTHRDRLRDIHERIERDGGFTTYEHRLLFEATKP
jgi:SAM-dependent methyltransferase